MGVRGATSWLHCLVQVGQLLPGSQLAASLPVQPAGRPSHPHLPFVAHLSGRQAELAARQGERQKADVAHPYLPGLVQLATLLPVQRGRPAGCTGSLRFN